MRPFPRSFARSWASLPRRYRHMNMAVSVPRVGSAVGRRNTTYSFQYSSWRYIQFGRGTFQRETTEVEGMLSDTQNGSGRISDSLAQRVTASTEEIIRDVLLPISQETRGPLAANADKRTPLPFVFLLGNHSSGKSSFINYVLKCKVQQTGVAPTDDGFTVIAAGERDVNQDGPSLIGDPDLGFSGLRAFGPSLIHHVVLKIRKDLDIRDIMFIDSPGMIDSPTDSISYVGNGEGRRDRGYDFEGATRWFAERADVILLFFDPDKPGTTGETLSVLTNSLTGMEHKLHIILNKVDQFEKIHDFARAYGSLCWNLSKVIPRKDIPKIYTMCTPLSESPQVSRAARDYNNSRFTSDSGSWEASLSDLEAQRSEVLEQVKLAPERRIDNMVTELYDSASLLLMHITVLENLRVDFQQARRRIMLAAVGVGGGGNLISLGVLYLLPSIWGFSATLSLSSLLGASGMYLYGNHNLNKRAIEMASPEYLEQMYNRLYVHEIAEGDEFTRALWLRAKKHIQSTLHTIGVQSIAKVPGKDFRALQRVIDKEIPELRRSASHLN